MHRENSAHKLWDEITLKGGLSWCTKRAINIRDRKEYDAGKRKKEEEEKQKKKKKRKKKRKKKKKKKKQLRVQSYT